MRAKRRRQADDDNQDRWLVSYADFMTLLLAFFVVMYAVSIAKEGDYKKLEQSMIEAFKGKPSSIDPIQLQVAPSQQMFEEIAPIKMVPPLDSGTTGETEQQQEQPPTELEKLQDLAKQNPMSQVATQVQQALEPLIEQGDVLVDQDELWVEIDIKSKVLFNSGRAVLQPAARVALSDLANVLRQFPYSIQVEGFTDDVPIANDIYPSNWELSAARAASVVHLFGNNGVDPQRMAAVGYGKYRPIAENNTADGRAKNRRVAIVVLADTAASRLIDVKNQLVE